MKRTGVAALCWLVGALIVLAVRGGWWHWSLFFVFLCGLVSAYGLHRAWEHRDGSFDPLVWLQVHGMYFFVAAPIVHLATGRFVPFPLVPDDWRPWLGRMAAYNLVGIIIREALLSLVYRRRRNAPQDAPLRVDSGRGATWSLGWMAAAFGALALLMWVYGGPLGYLAQSAARLEGFQSMGYLVLISDLLPLTVVMLLAIRIRSTAGTGGGKLPGIARVAAVLMVLQIAVGGLRGSRIQVVFFGFVALGVLAWAGLHLSRRMLIGCFAAALAFSYLYAFYKDLGPTAFVSIARTGSTADLRNPNDRDLLVLLLGDLGRSDIQALVLSRVAGNDPYLRLAEGRTYVSDVLVNVPTAIRPIGIEGWSKLDYGTELVLGTLPGTFRVGNIYGIAGEAMLNFGQFAAIPALGVHALIVLGVMNWIDGQRRRGRPVELLYTPIAILLITALMSDLDQIVYSFLRFGMMPVTVYLAMLVRPPTRGPNEPPITNNEQLAVGAS